MSNDGTPRRAKNLEGLLKFCLEATKSEDAPEKEAPRPLSKEEKDWISAAMQSAMGRDPVRVMIENIQLLSGMHEGTPAEGLKERKINALDELTEYCADIDLAKDFHKIGGYALLPMLMSYPDSELRWRCAELIATLAQNNPYCQKAALDMDLLKVVLSAVQNDSNSDVRIKSLLAVSCLSRECEEAQELLIRHDGVSVLVQAMQSDIVKLQIKSSFLMSYLAQTSQKLKEQLTEVGVVEQLVALLHGTHAAHHEHIMAALVSLADNNPAAQHECQRPELQLQTLLRERLKLLAGKEEFLEEEEHYRSLLQLCFTDSECPDK